MQKTAHDLLAKELSELRRQFGPEAEAKALKALALAVRWVRDYGHGSVTLNAIDHRFNSKLNINMLIDSESVSYQNY